MGESVSHYVFHRMDFHSFALLHARACVARVLSFMGITIFAAVIVASLDHLTAAEESPFFIEGYAGRLSVVPGESIAFHTSTSAPKFSAEIARIGAKEERVWSQKDIPGRAHPVPDNASSAGCGWPEAFRVPVDRTWPSGYYVARFRIEDRGGVWTQRGRRTAESEAWFVVRDAAPGTKTKILLQLCSNTYNAYNNWGGFSLYAYNGLAKNQGHRVSFERPPASQFSRWELPFVDLGGEERLHARLRGELGPRISSRDSRFLPARAQRGP